MSSFGTLEKFRGGNSGCLINDPVDKNAVYNAYRLVKSTISAASPQTLTGAQAEGGYVEVSTAGAFTLTTDTGANLDLLFPQLYVGLSFRCVVVGSGAGTTITFAGGVGVTMKGDLIGGSVCGAQLLFYRTGTATWDCVVVGGN